MTESNDFFEDPDIYSQAVDQMDTKVIIVSTLEILAGLFGIVQTIMFFFTVFIEGSIIYLIAFFSYGIFTATLSVLSLIAGWGLWRLEHWAWRIALSVSVASIVAYLANLSLLTLSLNVVIIWYLQKPQVRDIYNKIEVA